MTVVRVSIFTNYLLLREGLLRILSGDASFAVVHSGADVPPGPNGAFACDVALIDSEMDGALLRCATLTGKHDVRVIFLGVADDYAWSMEALKAGARGLASKTITAHTLFRAIRAVHQGALWIPDQLMLASIDRFGPAGPKRARHDNDVEALNARLSAREREVFRHAATGLSNKDLAELLHISEATVKVHLTNIFSKLCLRGRAELAAAYHGMLHQPPAVSSR